MAKSKAFSLGHLAFIAAQFKGNQTQTAESLGCHRDTVAKALKLSRNGQLQDVQPTPLNEQPEAKPAEPITPAAPPELVKADRRHASVSAEIKDLRTKYKEAIEQLGLSEQRLSLLEGYGDSSKIKPIPINRSLTGGQAAAIIQATDWHIEERVDRHLVNGLNEYNPEIARKRSANFFGNALKLVRKERKDVAIETLILHIGGDIITGYIHEELVESNFLSPTESILLAQEFLVGGIKRLRDDGNFKTIRVVCNYGNHGRTTPKIRVSTGHQNSYEWLLYKLMARDFADDPVVQFQVADAYVEYVDIFDYTLRFHHGDAIKYGGGIGGVTIPLIKYIHRLNGQRYAHGDFIGHYHQLTPYNRASKFAINGSLIGFNPYALRIGASPEPPLQNFQLVAAGKGFTVHAPIFVE
jgi:hypothetical protein